MRERNNVVAMGGSLAPVSGNLALQLHPPRSSVPGRELTIAEMIRHGLPRVGLPREVNEWRLKNAFHLRRGAQRVVAARALGIGHTYGQLSLLVGRCRCGAPERHVLRGLPCPEALWLDLGLASLRVVTTAGVGYIVDAFQNTVEPENMKYHGIGTTNTAESSGDTALAAEITTQYSTNNIRPTGSTTEGASANIYRTVGTITVDAAVAAVEHGIFSDPTVGSGVLLDRSVFATVNLGNGDSLQATYDLTFSAGS